MVDEINKILHNLRHGIPQALARFNDGECGIILDKNFTAARGCQKGSIELQVALIDAITYEQVNYWKGYPCKVCYPELYKKVIEEGYYNKDYIYNTMATVNTNRNLEYFSSKLPIALKGKQVVWVSGEDQKLDNITSPKYFNINVVERITSPLKNSWAHYSDILHQCLNIVMPHRVFLFSTGPTSRVLVKNLFQLRPDASFIDIGDTFSHITRGVWRRCHLGTLKACKECN